MGAPTLTTGRLTLRPLSPGDVDALNRISDEPLVRRYLWDDAPVSRADVEEVVESSRRMFSEERFARTYSRVRRRSTGTL